MALIILPTSTRPNANIEAQATLQAAILEPNTVIMVVSGDTPDIREVLQICVARASVKANIRRVVWVPDTQVYSPNQRLTCMPDRDTVAVAIGLRDAVAAALDLEKGKIRFYVEHAFLAAEAQ